MTLSNYLTIFSMCVIWLLVGINLFLSIGGFMHMHKMGKTSGRIPLAHYPFVSVMVPAHNEAKVLAHTVRALLALDYPQDRYEIIIINDNSTDGTAQMLRDIQAQLPQRNLIVVNTDDVVGGSGKSNALNIGLNVARGELLAIYDADNTPEPQALSILVENLMQDDTLGAVIGKFRTRNRNSSLLTRFVNIETLAYQCMNQAGRWFYFGLCTIPGTNFVIRRDVIEKIGGWGFGALAEDTEISFRIYQMGYRIGMFPQSVTWEQEPDRVDIWMKQRTRWAVGNLHVLLDNFRFIFDRKSGPVRLDILYYSMLYVLMLTALVCSDIIFVLGVLGLSGLSLGGLSSFLWGLACLLFVLNMLMTLALEKNEFSFTSTCLILLMLFTYSKMWVVVVVRAAYMIIRQTITKKRIVWYKTERTSG